jgi:hypothetical protein
MPIGLVERGAAQAFGLAAAEPESHWRVFPGRAARRLGTVHRNNTGGARLDRPSIHIDFL